jgi:hypothetical protein
MCPWVARNMGRPITDRRSGSVTGLCGHKIPANQHHLEWRVHLMIPPLAAKHSHQERNPTSSGPERSHVPGSGGPRTSCRRGGLQRVGRSAPRTRDRVPAAPNRPICCAHLGSVALALAGSTVAVDDGQLPAVFGDRDTQSARRQHPRRGRHGHRMAGPDAQARTVASDLRFGARSGHARQPDNTEASDFQDFWMGPPGLEPGSDGL